MKKILFFCAVITAIAACKKDEQPIPPVEKPTTALCMRYAMTQCADPWGYVFCGTPPTPTDSSLVVDYFAAHHIGATFGHISYTDPGIVCAACNCISGKTLFVEAANATEAAKLTALGFTTCTSAPVNNPVLGQWNYVWVSGGLSGISQTLVGQNQWIDLSASTLLFTAYNGATQIDQAGFSLVAKNASFPGDYGINYSEVSWLPQNYRVRNDSLWLYDAAYDGMTFTLVRR